LGLHRSPYDREIARLAVPALGALVAEPLYTLADTAVVGHLGTPHLGGLAVASQVLLGALSLFIFLAYGTTAAVGRLIGAGDIRFLAVAMSGAAAVFIPLALWVLAADAGIGWLWGAIWALMAARLVALVWRFTGTGWLVPGAVR